MLIYEGRAVDLTGERIFSNLSELWLNDPAKRRLMRRVGVEEAVVCGRKGDYPLLCAYLSALRQDPRARLRAQAELAVAFGMASERMNDPETFWHCTAEVLEKDIRFVPHLLERTGMERVFVPIPITEAPRGTQHLTPLADLSRVFTFGQGLRDALGENPGGMETLIGRLRNALDAFSREGCDAVLLTVQDRLPPCLRTTDSDADAWLVTAIARDGHGLTEAQRDALRARLLFGLLPTLRARGMRLILRAGVVEWGDGRLPCRFDAQSFAEIAARLESKMPRTLLLPRSRAAVFDMRALYGIFPAVDGEPTVEVAAHDGMREHHSPLSLPRMVWKSGISELTKQA